MSAATPRSARRRRVLLALVAGVLVLSLVVLAVVLATGDDEPATTASGSAGGTGGSESSAAPSETEAGDPQESAAPEPGAASPGDEGINVDDPPPSLPAVQLDETVEVEQVRISLPLIEEIQGEAVGPGNINGPSLRVTVRLVNETSADLDLSLAGVTMYYGPDRTPASPIEDRSRSPFSGVLPPGDAAEGVYVFRVPEEDRDRVTVEVNSQAGDPIAVFTGSVR